MKGVLAALVIVGVIVGTLWLFVATWQECTRVHPWWYCVVKR